MAEDSCCHPEFISGSRFGSWGPARCPNNTEINSGRQQNQSVILSSSQDLRVYSNPMKQYYIYILTNKSNKVLYIGVTNDLERRMYEHKNKMVDGFTERYNLTKLVYFEETPDVKSAIEREKQLKNWHRDWKINLINSFNPQWKDLSADGDIRVPEKRDPEINSGRQKWR